MKLKTRRSRKQLRPSGAALGPVHGNATGCRPNLRPQSLLSAQEFAALMAVASGQDPMLVAQA